MIRELLVLAVALAVPAHAQDFAAPAPAGPSGSPLAWLEGAPPLAVRGVRVEAARVQWFGVPELATRSLAFGIGAPSFTGALGASQTGPPGIGWSTAGVALGGASAAGGAALRAVARRDHDAAVASVLGPGVGVEAGGSAWLGVTRGLAVWAEAPQIWTRGLSPPLLRPLLIGVRAEFEALRAWLAHAAPTRAGAERADHAAGLGCFGSTWSLWLEARDHPLRGGFGFEARWARARVGFAVDGHPVLGETVRLSIGLARGETSP